MVRINRDGGEIYLTRGASNPWFGESPTRQIGAKPEMARGDSDINKGHRPCGWDP
jgi:hypothetical protein